MIREITYGPGSSFVGANAKLCLGLVSMWRKAHLSEQLSYPETLLTFLELQTMIHSLQSMIHNPQTKIHWALPLQAKQASGRVDKIFSNQRESSHPFPVRQLDCFSKHCWKYSFQSKILSGMSNGRGGFSFDSKSIFFGSLEHSTS